MVESLGVPREQFLATVRQALGRTSGMPPVPPYSRLKDSLEDLEAEEQALLERLSANREERITGLATTAGLRGWNVHLAADAEEALGCLKNILGELGVQRAVRSAQSIFDQVLVDPLLGEMGIQTTVVSRDTGSSPKELRQRMIDADVGITGVDYGVVETGSVVVVPGTGLSRLVSLAPTVHVALVRPEEIVDTLDDVFLLRRLAFHGNGGEMGSYLNFITGPSRTADIEQTLVVGVHGPKEVHMIILG